MITDRLRETLALIAGFYGFNRILPKYQNLETLVPDLGLQSIAGLYRKCYEEMEREAGSDGQWA